MRVQQELALPRHCAEAPYGEKAEPRRGETQKSTTFCLEDCDLAPAVCTRPGAAKLRTAYSTDTILNLIFAAKC